MKMILPLFLEVPDDIDPNDVARVVQKMLDIGQQDAVDSQDDPDLDRNADIDLAVAIEFKVGQETIVL